jgi:hypothetical protein
MNATSASPPAALLRQIDRLRGVLECLQREAPDLLSKAWWLEGELAATDDFLCALARTQSDTAGHPSSPPRPWPGASCPAYDHTLPPLAA